MTHATVFYEVSTLLFPGDIEKIVEFYGLEWAEKIIRVSQDTSWSKYILSSTALVQKAAALYEWAQKLHAKDSAEEQLD